MKSRLPLFRSAAQEAVLVVLFLRASGPLTLTEIAALAGYSVPAVHKEVERLESAGIVESHRRGRNRMVAVRQLSPYHQEIEALLTKAHGPPVLLRSALDTVAGVEEAFIFGSWALEGVDSRREPRDIDVMVIGTPDMDELYETVREVEEDAGRPINLTIRTRDEWSEDRSGFAETVRSGQRIQLIG